jgi:hypothetical protein
MTSEGALKMKKPKPEDHVRSGHFEFGEQVGEWTTYDKRGEVYKVTNMKPKKKSRSRPRAN